MQTESKISIPHSEDTDKIIPRKCQSASVCAKFGEKSKRPNCKVTFHLPALGDHANSDSYSGAGGRDPGTPGPLDLQLHVSHQHYEQWARVPGRRAVPSLLHRGIPQLKPSAGTNVTREKETTEESAQSVQNNRPKVHKEKTLAPKIWNIRRERSDINQTETTFSRSLCRIRSPMKLRNAQLNNVVAVDRDPERELDKTPPRVARIRNGFARFTDRCLFPVSKNSPDRVNDHVFLVDEPLRQDHLKQHVKSCLQQAASTKENSSQSHSGEQQDLTSALPCVSGDARKGDRSADRCLPPQRARTYLGSFPSRRSAAERPPAAVSSAEWFDFSQLTQLGHTSGEHRPLARQRTDVSLRGSRPFVFKFHD